MRMGFCEGFHSQFDTVLKWKCHFSRQTDLRTLQGLLMKCVFFFFLFGQIVNGDTGLNQSPSLLSDPTPPHSTSCLIFIR